MRVQDRLCLCSCNSEWERFNLGGAGRRSRALVGRLPFINAALTSRPSSSNSIGPRRLRLSYIPFTVVHCLGLCPISTNDVSQTVHAIKHNEDMKSSCLPFRPLPSLCRRSPPRIEDTVSITSSSGSNCTRTRTMRKPLSPLNGSRRE